MTKQIRRIKGNKVFGKKKCENEVQYWGLTKLAWWVYSFNHPKRKHFKCKEEKEYMRV